MFTSFIRIIVSVAAVFLSSHLYAKDVVHHKLNVKLNPDKHFIQVEDQLTLANSGGDHHVGFLLHKGLVPNVISIGVVLNKAQGVSEEESSDIADYYELEVPQGVKTVTLSYQGDIYHPVEQQGEEYARSFSESPGIIEPDGVFLSSSSFWYPQLEEKLISFSLQVELPKTWDVVSQGKRILHEIIKGKRVTGWEESHPQDDIYIVAAKFKEYTQAG